MKGGKWGVFAFTNPFNSRNDECVAKGWHISRKKKKEFEKREGG